MVAEGQMTGHEYGVPDASSSAKRDMPAKSATALNRAQPAHGLSQHHTPMLFNSPSPHLEPSDDSLSSSVCLSLRSSESDVVASLWQANRTSPTSSGLDHTAAHSDSPGLAIKDDSLSRSAQRLTPQILTSVRRSRKAGDTVPTVEFADKTDVVPTTSTVTISRIRQLHPAACSSTLTSSPATNAAIYTADARRLGLPLPRRCSSGFSLHINPKKSLTFSPTRSPLSSVTDLASLSSSHHINRAPTRQHLVSPSFPRHSGGLVALAARKVERQLQERALAAFPNDDRQREPVYHYVDHDDTPPASSLASSAGSAFSSMHEIEIQSWRSENWELRELRAHHDKLHAEREEQRLKREARRRLHKHLNENPWAIPVAIPEDQVATKTIDDLIMRDRPRVRAPMLGSDIAFPRSDSPDPARFDVTQGPDSLKKTMCYLSEQSELHASSSSPGGLWIPRNETSTTMSCTWSRPASRNPSAAGLWGGSCIDTNSPPRAASGLMTPKLDEEAQSLPKDTLRLLKHHLPPSPPMSSSGAAVIEEQQAPLNIEAEFDDSFITQVFNYMSLGYPAIARDFDEELSKVTGTPLADLRKDDDLPRACGYIRLGEETAALSGVTELGCARWKALRLYVHEWARQHPNLAQPKPMDSGWVAARKGSWAW